MFFMQKPIIQLQGVHIYQNKKKVFSNISFTIYPGEFVFLIGKTGSGKSSLLRTLYADLSIHSGKAVVLGYALKKLKKRKIPFLRRNLGIVFQDFQLLFDRTVEENLYFVLHAVGYKKKYIPSKITEVLVQVGLIDKKQKMPHELSGGEQQRIAIARALLNDPLVLLADEPTGNLDPEVAQEIIQLFLDINLGGTTVVMATHNYTFLSQNPTKKVFRCYDGYIEAYQPCEKDG